MDETYANYLNTIYSAVIGNRTTSNFEQIKSLQFLTNIPLMKLSKIQLIRKRNFELLLDQYPTRKEAGKNLGLSPSQVSDYANGIKGMAEKLANRIEAKAKIPEGILSIEHPKLSHNRKFTFSDEASTKFNLKTQGYYPLIDWSNAGDWEKAVMSSSKVKSWPFHEKDQSDKTFCLNVLDDSMTNRACVRPSYLKGDIIFIDPDKVDLSTNGSAVLARLIDSQTHNIIFRTLIIQGTKSFLKPINDTYPIIYDDFEIIGLVLGGVYSYM